MKKKYFSQENDEKKFVESFYDLALECAINWGYIFPNVLDKNNERKYQIRSNEIKNNKNIIIPKTFIHFKNDSFFEEINETRKKLTNENYGKFYLV